MEDFIFKYDFVLLENSFTLYGMMWPGWTWAVQHAKTMLWPQTIQKLHFEQAPPDPPMIYDEEGNVDEEARRKLPEYQAAVMWWHRKQCHPYGQLISKNVWTAMPYWHPNTNPIDVFRQCTILGHFEKIPQCVMPDGARIGRELERPTYIFGRFHSFQNFMTTVVRPLEEDLLGAFDMFREHLNSAHLHMCQSIEMYMVDPDVGTNDAHSTTAVQNILHQVNQMCVIDKEDFQLFTKDVTQVSDSTDDTINRTSLTKYVENMLAWIMMCVVEFVGYVHLRSESVRSRQIENCFNILQSMLKMIDNTKSSLQMDDLCIMQCINIKVSPIDLVRHSFKTIVDQEHARMQKKLSEVTGDTQMSALYREQAQRRALHIRALYEKFMSGASVTSAYERQKREWESWKASSKIEERINVVREVMQKIKT